MCGIVGFIELNKNADISVIESMERLLKHRGPDDSGTEVMNIACGEKNLMNFALGFVRLSIRDLSITGHQPMRNSDNTIVITFNGEIYNADELKVNLEKKGYKFKGTSDTEVLLCLYENYGIEDTLRMLDGMFAICIADKKKDCVYLIRDRIGEKPLYIYKTDTVLLFSSEYKAFYCHPEFKAQLNEEAIDEYFLFRYVSGGETMLKGVNNLEPGTYLRISSNQITKHEYWCLPNSSHNSKSKEENAKLYNQLFAKGVRRRLISDRKVGLQLSGGVDSSYLASVAIKEVGVPLQSFGITFDEEKFSEEKNMDYVNERLGCIPHKYNFINDRFFKCWKESTWFFEQPMNHEGTLGLLYLNRKAVNEVTVMLCGEGADETLGGYNRFPVIQYNIKHWWGKYLLFAYQWIKNKSMPLFIGVDKQAISLTQYINDKTFIRLLNKSKKNIRRIYDKRLSIMNKSGCNGLTRYRNYEIRTYMQDCLMRADKTSMASSLEVRTPYIMPELVEFIATIPDEQLTTPSYKQRGHHSKLILKDLCESVFGHEFTYRKKVGFDFPLLRFFDDNEIVLYVESVLIPGIKKRGILDYCFVKDLWESRHTSKYSYLEYHEGIWCSLSFEMWCQMYLDHTPMEWQHELF